MSKFTLTFQLEQVSRFRNKTTKPTTKTPAKAPAKELCAY